MSDIHALSGAYAVDALDEHERRQFERHLAKCAECRAEVSSLREASATLTEISSAQPPAALRDSVLSAITTVRPLPPAVETAPPARRRLPLLVAAAAAVVAVVGGGVLAAQPWDSEPELTAAERVIEADDVRSVSADVDGAEATLYVSEELGQAALVTEDMPEAPAGKVYELWLQKDGEMVPAGLMTDEDEPFVLEGDTGDASAAGITIEPAGGSREPTMAPLAVFRLDQAT